eukprot:759871-Rhodomonas_salina.2
MLAAKLIISHAGAGSVMEALRNVRPFSSSKLPLLLFPPFAPPCPCACQACSLVCRAGLGSVLCFAFRGADIACGGAAEEADCGGQRQADAQPPS